MASRTHPNLVIGAVRGYNFEQLRPFIVSLKRTSFSGDLVLLWNNLSSGTLAALAGQGVKLAPFAYRGSGSLNSWSRFWPQLRPLLRCPVGDGLRRAVYRRILNLAFVRYLHALDFLEAHRGVYQNILLTDVRDVIFQDDPFREPLPGKITAFLESPRMTFGSEPLNDGWILENYGPVMAEKLRGKRISCCGTVAGTETGMIDYLQAFAGQILRLKSVAHGADTSVHNVLVREAPVEGMAVVENFQGAVGTINSDATAGVVFGKEWQVLGPNELPVPVLHQYDRLPELKASLMKQFSLAPT